MVARDVRCLSCGQSNPSQTPEEGTTKQFLSDADDDDHDKDQNDGKHYKWGNKANVNCLVMNLHCLAIMPVMILAQNVTREFCLL